MLFVVKARKLSWSSSADKPIPLQGRVTLKLDRVPVSGTPVLFRLCSKRRTIVSYLISCMYLLTCNLPAVIVKRFPDTLIIIIIIII